MASRIATSHYRSGERITEESLAREFNLSRTPVREALRLLEHAGLVERASPRGYQVKMPDLAALSHIYTVRATLEELCVDLVGSAVGTPRFDALRDRVLVVGEPEGDHGIHFHEELVMLTGNPELIRILSDIYLRTRPYARLDAAIRERAEVIYHDHLEILSLLELHDIAGAKTLMREHIARTRGTIESLIQAGVRAVTFSPTSDTGSTQSLAVERS